MTLHKLSAGSGYEYLTRQVAAADSTELGNSPLADYYAAKGEAPGRWIGSGLGDIDGLAPGDLVTAEQMRNLFGQGLHPLFGDENPLRLGAAYRTYSNERAVKFAVEVVRRIEQENAAAGRPAKARPDRAMVARIRSEVAAEFFVEDHGRLPKDARELAGAVARYSRFRTAVAGFDLTFSPVKSVSVLWALAPMQVARRIEAAHEAAFAEALRFIEEHALYTREGANGARQVEVSGLLGTAFTHRDSRAGDPDLHTHVAVANKVRTREGRWLTIYGKVLYEHVVAASEVYNTALERHLADDLGLEFAERPAAPGKRPVREIVGVDAELCEAWSARRVAVVARQRELTIEFEAVHGRPPSKSEAYGLAQQANLETREAKHEPRSLAEQRATWRSQAVALLGEQGVRNMLDNVLGADAPAPREAVTTKWVENVAARVVGELEARAATWQDWHLHAEAMRQIRAAADGVDLPAEHLTQVTAQVVDAARSRCVNLTPDLDEVAEPAALRRSDGVSVYRHTGADRYTTARILAAEERILAAAGRTDGAAVAADDVDLAMLELHAGGLRLNDAQRNLVTRMAASGRRVEVGVAPAGTGKTTAMRALTHTWRQAGGRGGAGGNVIGLAPSAAAAAALRGATGMPCDTLAKVIEELHHTGQRSRGGPPSWLTAIGPDTLVIIDEAAMADTLTLDTVIAFAIGREASVRLVGDDQQLAAIGAGGILRNLDHTIGAMRLDEPVRFTDPAEATATLALRDGDPSALGFYLDHDRVHVTDQTTVADRVYAAWANDRAAGLDALMLAPTRDLVAELNQRAQADRLTELDDRAVGRGTALSDGHTAYVGEVILTRHNDRRLRITGTDWVKNGDRWTVTKVRRNGALTARHHATGLSVTLPAAYLAEHTQLGYASTVHTAQGVTADTTHGILTGTESRQLLYTMLTRGRHANHVHVLTACPDAALSGSDIHMPTLFDLGALDTATETLEGVLARDGAAISATSVAQHAAAPATRLHQAALRYEDAVHAAAEHLIGPQRTDQIAQHAERALPELTDQPAWPALRARLTLAEADGHDATRLLDCAIIQRELTTAEDQAAVLTWRVDRLAPAGKGPLPWLPAVPRGLTSAPEWCQYVTARAAQVHDLTDHVLTQSRRVSTERAEEPVWMPTDGMLPDDLSARVAVWRAATDVAEADRRPTGATQHHPALRAHQRALERRLAEHLHELARRTWEPVVVAAAGRRDQETDTLADYLEQMRRLGLDPAARLREAIARGLLPDDYPTAALTSRIIHDRDAAGAEHDARPEHKHAPARTRSPARPQSPDHYLGPPHDHDTGQDHGQGIGI
ncbi:relaxase domain-containing protein [Myceligenerans sp. TRM 65318]|uniref:Relaxase domain-containing protein n=2 Tax=Myceligenerans pegani TaxID=2776917 RepID=A0ABR9MVL1_9MICO|nr:MobF family relaxase [Myceligenerans sp. TRM 65318]MBE1875046.1 relaxase domain-containing protein [Myceligenerans sp. TRM 65318]